MRDTTMPELPDWLPETYDGRFDGLDQEVGQAYLDKLRLHIGYVIMAGRELGVPEEQLMEHDRSKLSSAEFPFYARWKMDPDEFALAWLNHKNKNKHHWNYWIFPFGYSPKGSRVENGIVEMPENYALEMIADWLGAGRAYEGSWNISDWLKTTMPTIYLHSNTARFVRDKLIELGYENIVKSMPFGSEVVRGYIDENAARYIVRMLSGYDRGVLPIDGTTGDEAEFERMERREREMHTRIVGWEQAQMEFVLRIASRGVPGGKYLEDVALLAGWMGARPFIERSDWGPMTRMIIEEAQPRNVRLPDGIGRDSAEGES